ncbi:MAG: PKD domain-containing protein, partial [Candidatus Paceibacterota bacterium]
LQQFLGGRVTGYFGPVTLQLVQQWQSAHGVIASGDPDTTGFGFVGPKTRAAMAQGCANATGQTTFSGGVGSTGVGSGPICPVNMSLRTACPAGQHYEYGPVTYDSARCPIQDAKCVPDTTISSTFSASPTSGAAPLAVRFTTSEKSGTINFGDGTSGTIQAGPLGVCYFGGTCTGGGYGASHTYTSAGTYTATLSKGGGICFVNGISSFCGSPDQQIGTVTITVGDALVCTNMYRICPAGTHNGGKCNQDCIPDNTSATLSASPTTGAAPLLVTFQIPAASAGGIIKYGDGAQENVPFFACQTTGITGPCTMPLNHTYASAGTYTAQLLNSSQCITAGCNVVGTATINVFGSQGRGITVTSPNGGERWNVGSQQNITWNDGRVFIAVNPYDVFLDRTMPRCDNPLMGCPQMMPAPLTLAKGVTGHAFSWTVGKVLEPIGAGAGSGDYTVRVCDSNNATCDSSDSQFTIVDPAYENNRPPVISGFTGPASLTVGQKGTWIVQASDPEGKKLTYTYSWCDVTNGGYSVCSAQAYPVGGETTNAFTTDFPSAGTYKVSVSVSDDIGKSAQASATVTIGGGTTNATFSASPTSGAAPLTVAFRATAGDEQSLNVNFGDGTSGQMSVTEGGAARGVNHTYAAPGTYTASLVTAGSCTFGYCGQAQSVTITVTGGNTGQPSLSIDSTQISIPADLPSTISGTAGNLGGTLVLTITNSSGQSVYTGQTSASAGASAPWSFNIPSLSAGAYGVTVQSAQNNFYRVTANLTVTNPSAYIDGNTLNSTNGLPLLSGGSTAVASLEVGVSLIQPGGGTNGFAWRSGALTPDRSGRWSAQVTNTLAPGSYEVDIYHLPHYAFLTRGTLTVSSTNCGDNGCSYRLDPSLYPTQTVSGTGASAGNTNPNLANALTALESALKALIAKLAQ